MAKFKKANFDCPDCGEPLKLKKDGYIQKKDQTSVAAAYVCQECDQMYAIIDGQVAYYPADAKGKATEYFCKTCGARECHRQRVIWLCDELLIMNSYCVDCAIEQLRNCDLFNLKNKEDVNKSNVYEVADLQHTFMSNKVSMTPDLLRKAMNTPAQRKLAKSCGMTDEQIDKRIEELCANPMARTAISIDGGNPKALDALYIVDGKTPPNREPKEEQ